jgi:hypothetical protein
MAFGNSFSKTLSKCSWSWLGPKKPMTSDLTLSSRGAKYDVFDLALSVFWPVYPYPVAQTRVMRFKKSKLYDDMIMI